MKVFFKSFASTLVGFLAPYFIAGALHLMGSINYWSVVTTDSFIQAVIWTTILAAFMSAITQINRYD